MGVTPHINMDRVARYVSHLAPEAAAASADDDIVIVSAIRTAICRARKGGFRDTQPDALLSAVLKETVARAPNAPIGDIVVGNVLQGGAGALTSRMAQLCAGISEDVPCHAINRQCSSGLQAVATVAGQIKMGVYDFGIAAGVESMSKGNMMDAAPKEMNPEIFECEAAQDCMIPIIGKFVSYACVGCPPNLMGIGPAVAIPAALKKAGMSIGDIDIFEVNEAFASQAVYCVDSLKIPREKCNPKGGAIALGHPLGATGARQVGTLLHELRRTGKKTGVISMCIGTGMGAAAVFEAEH